MAAPCRKAKNGAAVEKRQSFGNWSPVENTACLGAFFEMASEQQVEQSKEQERKCSLSYPHWLKKLLYDPDYRDFDFKFQDGHYTDISSMQLMPWTAEVAGPLRAKSGSLVKRAKDPILKTIVNVIQPAYWAYMNKDGSWPSGKTEADCIAFMLRFMSDREHEEKAKLRAAKTKAKTPPLPEVVVANSSNAPDSLGPAQEVPPQGVLAYTCTYMMILTDPCLHVHRRGRGAAVF